MSTFIAYIDLMSMVAMLALFGGVFIVGPVVAGIMQLRRK